MKHSEKGGLPCLAQPFRGPKYLHNLDQTLLDEVASILTAKSATAVAVVRKLTIQLTSNSSDHRDDTRIVTFIYETHESQG